MILTMAPPLFVIITFLSTKDLWSQISKVQRVGHHLGFDPHHWIITETYGNWPPIASRVTCQRYGAGFLAQEKRYGQLSVSCILFSESENGEMDVFDFGLRWFGIVREVCVCICTPQQGCQWARKVDQL